jgi:hypothetical protein
MRSFIKKGSDIQKQIEETYRHTDCMVSSYSYFHFFKVRKVGYKLGPKYYTNIFRCINTIQFVA